MDEISLFTDAIACLKETLKEGEKDSNVDIQLMLRNIQRCQSLVDRLKQTDEDHFYTSALEKLQKNLHCQSEILVRKINQLNSDHQEDLLPQAKKSISSLIAENPESASVEGQFSGKEKTERRSAIEDTILSSRKVKFSDVAGLHEAKQALTEAIIIPLHYPQLFTGGRKPWKRILLFGPPGTGKSRLAQAVAAEINSTFYCVSSADLISSWVGESENPWLDSIDHIMTQIKPSSFVLDEIFGEKNSRISRSLSLAKNICRKRSSREEEHTRRVKTELLKQMEGADNSDSSDKIFLLCATNCPWELDSAFLRRFQKRIYIPLPDSDARMQLIQIHSTNSLMNLSPEDWNMLALQTEGYSGSDIAAFTLGALFEPVRDLQNSQYWKPLPNGKLMPCDSSFCGALTLSLSEIPPDKIAAREVVLGDFLKALQTHRKTVTESELQKFHDFTESFGEN